MFLVPICWKTTLNTSAKIPTNKGEPLPAKELKRKIILLGDGAVGKTSLIDQYVYNTFSENYLRTVGVRVSQKMLKFNTPRGLVDLNLFVWDLYGQKEESIKNPLIHTEQNSSGTGKE